ncbi:hypothetical protein [Humisphaera borealis]|uniref:PsbP C-terminal domain-containing protein n=1 Tax=Humisphaera borealis TaxID=2807512 RepID=A0A7M2X2D0_9BACT|nr:hypothetical protein [Humisphaera borealis]QOV91873.1 hypothetical protein IPV69_11175 [Humisphaera borealis]
MPTRHRSPAGTALLLACSFALAGVSGCKDKPAAGPATAPAAAASMATAELNGVSFQYPADWKITKTPDGSGVNVTAARDGDWEPNVFLRIQSTQGEKAIDEELAENAALLAASKDDYKLRNSGVVDHPAGFKYTRIEYNNSVSVSEGNVPVQQWSILIPLKKGSRLQVQVAADATVWSKHQPTFEKIVDSIKLPK